MDPNKSYCVLKFCFVNHAADGAKFKKKIGDQVLGMPRSYPEKISENGSQSQKLLSIISLSVCLYTINLI